MATINHEIYSRRMTAIPTFPDLDVDTTIRVLNLAMTEQERSVPTNGGAFLFDFGTTTDSAGQVTPPTGQVEGQVTPPTGQVEGQVTPPTGQVDEKITALLRAAVTPLSRAELLSAIGLSNKYERFARYVQPLIDTGWLEMTQPDTPRSPTQRYRTTPDGQALLKTRLSQ